MNAARSSALGLFTGCYKSRGAQKAATAAQSRQSQLSLGSPPLFVEGERKETITGFCSYQAIVESASNADFHAGKITLQSGRAEALFINNGIYKNKRTLTKLAARRISHENKTSIEFTKMRAEVQLSSARPGFAS